MKVFSQFISKRHWCSSFVIETYIYLALNFVYELRWVKLFFPYPNNVEVFTEKPSLPLLKRSILLHHSLGLSNLGKVEHCLKYLCSRSWSSRVCPLTLGILSSLYFYKHFKITFNQIFKDLLFFREIGRERERKRGEHPCDHDTSIGCLLSSPTRARAWSLGTCPDRESEWPPFDAWDTLRHGATPARVLFISFDMMIFIALTSLQWWAFNDMNTVYFSINKILFEMVSNFS